MWYQAPYSLIKCQCYVCDNYCVNNNHHKFDMSVYVMKCENLLKNIGNIKNPLHFAIVCCKLRQYESVWALWYIHRSIFKCLVQRVLLIKILILHCWVPPCWATLVLMQAYKQSIGQSVGWNITLHNSMLMFRTQPSVMMADIVYLASTI